MYKYGVSGQVLFFGLFSTSSGLAITSGASAISAKRTVDNSGLQTSCSGVLSEPGSGQYAFQGWAADFTGNHIGFMFTASGAAPVHYNVDTEGAISGALSPASGANVVASLISGQQVQVWSGTSVNVFSGTTVSVASGASVSLVSGQQVLILSGATVALFSGQSVTVSSGQLSGYVVTARTVLDKSGYALSSDGLDYIQVESGMNFRQSQSAVAAAAAGRLSGAGTTRILIDGAGVSGTNRIDATVTASGNRTSVTLSLPA